MDSPTCSTRRTLLLCVDQADNRTVLIDPLYAKTRTASCWSYPSREEDPTPFRPTDAKRVTLDGEVYVLISYHGRVRLIRFKDGQVIRDYPAYRSCHSAEVLPDGSIVTASSTHGMLSTYTGTEEPVDLEIPSAHGLTWDKERNCLWALGDRLYRLSWSGSSLGIEKAIDLPMTPTGHDLFPLREEAKLLITNDAALFLFDIATERFETISELRKIKSASQHVDGSIWITEPVDLEGYEYWQSDRVMRVRPTPPEVHTRFVGAKYYKARWWQDVTFSY